MPAPDIETDVAVIGAGVVGLAVAAAISKGGRSVLLLERNSHPGQETSARNSEVIHAGIYYPPGSLKAKLCVDGKHRLYDYAEQHAIPHRRLGKLIVCHTRDQQDKIERLHAQAMQNGVTDCKLLTAEQCSDAQPGVRALAGMFSPSTGIIDSHAFMECLLGEVQQADGEMVCNVEVQLGEATGDGVRLEAKDTVADEAVRICSRWMINCAGLWAHVVAKRIAGLAGIPKIHFAKGHYFSIQGGHPFKHLVYPMPSDGGLGVHLTLDMAGQLKAGPDVEWLDHDDPGRIDYSVPAEQKHVFLSSIRQYWPEVPEHALQADYAGVRAKLHGPGTATRDFLIQSPQDHGTPGVVNLYGIESPGLTSSLAIAEHVKHILDRHDG
eukprot:jgi/Ulvmu1/500/UM001_0508.1